MRIRVLLRAVLVAGVASSVPAAAKVEGNTIVLGAAVSITGKFSIDGQHTKNGYDLAVKRVNEQGGVKVGGKSYKIEVRYYDDESSNERAASLVERLIAQDGIKFILGPYSSPLTGAIAPVTEKYKIPMVEGNGASRSLFTKGYKYLFAVLSTSEQYLSSAVDLAAEKSREAGKDPSGLRLALAMGDDSFSLDVRAGILEAAKRHGMAVVIDDKVPDNFTDMSATLSRVKAVKPDALQRAGGFDQEKVRDALARTDLQTFYGPIKFDETGKNVVKPMMLYQVQGGDYKVVAPTKWATAKIIYPRPSWSKRGS